MNVKIKLTLEAIEGVDVQFYDFFNHSANWVGWLTPRPVRLTCRNEVYPLYRRLGGPQGRSGRTLETSAPPAFDPRTVQPVARRYTD